MALTEKQKRFCDEYLIDLNATQAAIRAGYSEKTAKQVGYENLTKPYIREYIDERLAEKEEKLVAKQDEVMKYLTSVMRREENDSVVVTLNQERSTYAPDEHGTMRKQTIKEEVPKIVAIPTKVSDANKAAELLGKAYGVFRNEVNITGELPIVLKDDVPDD